MRCPKIIEAPFSATIAAVAPAAACVLSIALSSGVTWAGDLWQLPLHPDCWPNCVGKLCPDDYCRKPAPCICEQNCYTCDDYCPKGAPCPCPVRTFCCDDYCRKGAPDPCCGPKQAGACAPPGWDWLLPSVAGCTADSADGSAEPTLPSCACGESR